MADETDKPVATDSRVPGFNPEVEASHAEAEAAQLKAAAEALAGSPAAPPPPAYTHRCAMCGGLYEQTFDTCQSCGASGSVEILAKPAGA